MALKENDLEVFCEIIERATNSELYKLQEYLDKEIRLSEISIGEGDEKKK